MFGFLNSARYDMQVSFWSDKKPGMSSIVKRFGNCIKTYNIFIKISTDLQVNNIKSNMINSWRGLGI